MNHTYSNYIFTTDNFSKERGLRAKITHHKILGDITASLVIINLIAGIFLLPQDTHSQETELRFRHLTTQQGLSNNIINCITQDHHGFIWIGTMEGLNRYDGSNTTIFLKDLHDSTSIADNMIYDIYIDHTDHLWVGTQSGVCLYNDDHENFTSFILNREFQHLNTANRITGIKETSDDQIYFAAEQGYVYTLDRKSLTFTTLDYNFRSIRDFIIDRDDNFWLGGTYGVYQYNRESNRVEHYTNFTENNRVRPIQEVNSIFEEGDTIWIGTIKGRIFYLLKSTKEIHSLTYNFNLTYYIYDIFKSSKGLFYFSTTDGLFIYDKQTDSYTSYYHEDDNPYGMNGIGVTCVFEDQQNNLWIGTYQGGVDLITSNKEFLNYNKFSKGITLDIRNINSILEDSKGNLWLGSFDNGIDVISPANNKRKTFFHNPDDPGSLGYGSVYSIFEDSRSGIWVGTYLGYLQKYDPVTGSFRSFPFNAATETNNQGLDVRSIIEDKEGKLWLISHSNGLCCFDPKTKIYRHYLRDDNDLENSLADNWAFQILDDHEGYFWIATPSGLSRFDPRSERFTNFYHSDDDSTSLCNNFISVIFEDSNHNLWIGTRFGLSRFDRETQKFINYYEYNGLPSNHIKAILEHRPGELWLTTGIGLCRLRYMLSASGRERIEFRSYNQSDNLQDIFFHERSACKTREGKLIFGGESGIVMFDPNRITENRRIPEVCLTSFELFNEVVRPGDKNSVISRHIRNEKEIRLKYNQNFFTFNYIAINYISNENNQYKYQLVGLDPDWVNAGNERQASYTGVRPGKYIFRVVASNNDGYWNMEGTSINVVITPPLYGRWWFRILVVLMIISLSLAYYLNRVRNLRKQNITLENRVRERTEELSALNERISQQNDQLELQKSNIEKAYKELNKYRNKLEELVDERTKELIREKERAEAADNLKSSFLANLSHEIRTPLNAIIGFSGLMFEPDVPEEERLSYKAIIESSNNTLLSLINDIIDFSKIESGHLDIVMKEVSLAAILEDMHKIFSLEINKIVQDGSKNIEFRLNIDEKSKGLVLYTDEIRLKQLLSNLLNNAIKFTEKGYIEVGCSIFQKDRLEFYVKDTGIGIDKKFHQVIFERFRKLEQNSQIYRGAGLGLTISFELAKLLGGKLHVDSEPGKGARFAFTVPISKGKEAKTLKNEHTANRELPNLFDKQILIAEDDIASYEYLEKLLRRTKAKILHAPDGKEAVKIFRQNPDIALILMDIKMPYIDGIEALGQMMKHDLKIPVIAQTAYAFSDEIRRIKAAGFNDYISKPINSIELYKLLNKYL